MKKLALLAAVAACILATAPAMADEALAKAKNCMACHAVDKKMVGPAYKDVAAKFGGQKDAGATLVKAIIEGSKGVWGRVPLPLKKVTEAEAKQLVTWILSLK